jgi:hypothetical protein
VGSDSHAAIATTGCGKFIPCLKAGDFFANVLKKNAEGKRREKASSRKYGAGMMRKIS